MYDGVNAVTRNVPVLNVSCFRKSLALFLSFAMLNFDKVYIILNLIFVLLKV